MTLKVNANGEIVEASRNYGWDGSAWRKLPLVWGYSDRYIERELNSNADAGANTLTFSTVPAGEVWVIEGGTAYNSTSGNDQIYWNHAGTGIAIRLRRVNAPSANEEVRIESRVILKADDAMQAYFTGCTAGDTIAAYVWGYKMKIAE